MDAFGLARSPRGAFDVAERRQYAPADGRELRLACAFGCLDVVGVFLVVLAMFAEVHGFFLLLSIKCYKTDFTHLIATCQHLLQRKIVK